MHDGHPAYIWRFHVPEFTMKSSLLNIIKSFAGSFHPKSSRSADYKTLTHNLRSRDQYRTSR